jgi:hypothetical protein
MGHTQPTQNNNNRPGALVLVRANIRDSFFSTFPPHAHGHVQVYARLRHIKRTMQDARAEVAI